MKATLISMLVACAACGGGVGDATEAVGQGVVHSNGLGDSWTDMSPLGTFGAAQAMAACNAVPLQTSCIDWPAPMCNGGQDSMVMTYGPEPLGPSMWAWVYAGPNAGKVEYATTSCKTMVGTNCTVVYVGGNLCLPPGTTLPADQAQPPIQFVGTWQ